MQRYVRCHHRRASNLPELPVNTNVCASNSETEREANDLLKLK